MINYKLLDEIRVVLSFIAVIVTIIAGATVGILTLLITGG